MRPVQPAFDETIHAPHRLRIMVALSTVESMEFGAIRDDLGVADSVLSKQLKVLVDAGYVTLDKPTGLGGRPRTWAKITKAGRAALAGHLAELRRLLKVRAENENRTVAQRATAIVLQVVVPQFGDAVRVDLEHAEQIQLMVLAPVLSKGKARKRTFDFGELRLLPGQRHIW